MRKLRILLTKSTLLAVALLFSLPLFAMKASAAPAFNEYTLPTANAAPWEISKGADGNLWFTENNGHKIGRITPSGVVTEYASSSLINPQATASGADGRVWFGDSNTIGAITTSGTISHYPLDPSSYVNELALGSDGNIWFSEAVFGGNNRRIGRITPSGTLSEYALPVHTSNAGAYPVQLTLGPDGNIWYTAYDQGNLGSYVGKITPDGIIQEYQLSAFEPHANQITTGPDGALWFGESDFSGQHVMRMTTEGVVTNTFTTPSGIVPGSIATGPDGKIWFTSQNGTNSSLISMTTTGVFAQYTIPTSFASPNSLTVGQDGALWFTEVNGNSIGRFGEAPIIPGDPTNLTATSPAKSPALSWSVAANTDHYNVYRDGVNIGSTSTTAYSDSTANDGDHSYYVIAVSSTGNTSNPSNVITVSVDKTAPVAQITSPNANAIVSGVVVINGTITDAHPLRYYIGIFDSQGHTVKAYAVNNPSSNTISYSWDTTTAPNGRYTITLSAIDTLGNKDANSTQSIKVDVLN